MANIIAIRSLVRTARYGVIPRKDRVAEQSLLPGRDEVPQICVGDGCIDAIREFSRGELENELGSLPVYCDASQCEIVNDMTAGDCRSVQFRKWKAGFASLLVCEKRPGYFEAYFQEEDAAFDYDLCVLDLCVGPDHGFVSFGDVYGRGR
ncbi:MAG: hypothetical protein ACOCWQ_04605 [Nanoarchaeota archaeon]